MIVPKSDAELFFKLMWPLQVFINTKLNLVPDCATVEALKKLPMEQRKDIRDAVYANMELIEQFVEENSPGFNDEELDIVRRWRQFLTGNFFIERFLSKYAIFIKDKKVYAVLGLNDPFDSFVARESLPFYVQTVLLPFKGKIVYDGMMHAHRIYFGSGIRGDLKETYLTAKQNGQIIESLEPAVSRLELEAGGKPKQPAKDWRAEVDALCRQAEMLKTGATTPALQGAVFKLVKASLELAQSSVQESNDPNWLSDQARKVDRALRRVQATIERAKYR
jgi:hypothetical protein